MLEISSFNIKKYNSEKMNFYKKFKYEKKNI